MGVHVEEGDEGEDAGGEGGVPGQGEGVPEDERRVLPTEYKIVRKLFSAKRPLQSILSVHPSVRPLSAHRSSKLLF